MINAFVIITHLLVFPGISISITNAAFGLTQARPRVAIIGLKYAKEHGSPVQLENALVEFLKHEPRVSLIDETLVRPAVTGLGYGGSINMSKDEARKLGAVVGCDFFVIGKAEAFSRSDHENESHEEAYVAIMIVNGRSGDLEVFDLISSKAATKENAVAGVLRGIGERGGSYVDRMVHAGAASAAPVSEQRAREPADEIPAAGSARTVGFTPPEFLNRVKPEYPPEADLADITATVEAMVVFRSDGQVGNIEITRWAGFGLEESSQRAIRQLKFKPAMRDGRPINVRALIQYNFRKSGQGK